MKFRKLILIFILGFIDAFIFLAAASYLYASYWGVWGTFSIPTGYFVTLVIALFILIPYLIITRLLKFIPFCSQIKVTSIKETAVLIVMGLIVGIGILFLRDFVPSYLFYKKEGERQTSINNFRQEVSSNVKVGQPVFIVKDDFANSPPSSHQFIFSIEMPIKINKSFTKTQLLNTFRVRFASQSGKAVLPPIKGCSTSGFPRPMLVSPELSEGENNPGSYKLIFSYDFYSTPNIPAYSRCSAANAEALQGDSIVLFISGNAFIIKNASKSQDIGVYPIKTIQYK